MLAPLEVFGAQFSVCSSKGPVKSFTNPQAGVGLDSSSLECNISLRCVFNKKWSEL